MVLQTCLSVSLTDHMEYQFNRQKAGTHLVIGGTNLGLPGTIFGLPGTIFGLPGTIFNLFRELSIINIVFNY
ncbi:MAG: hypothetical protein Q8N38_09310 [Bacteroidales bacterium]|nr:hypothetical protein [Bacteroidales bacterium]